MTFYQKTPITVMYMALGLLICQVSFGQQTQILQGVVSSPYDNSIILSEVQIKNSSGVQSHADPSGKYLIVVKPGDTVRFFYKNRLVDAYFYLKPQPHPTYDVTIIMDESAKAHELATVKVYGKGYKEDSLARRRRYSNLYDYQDPKVRMGNNKWSESVGVMGEKMQLNTMDKKFSLLDVRSLASVFGFKKRKQRKRAQHFALEAEQMAYIRHRMKRSMVEKYGQIHDEDSLTNFIQRYSPSFDKLKEMTDFELSQFIITQVKLYRKNLPAER
jgi:hypothetical protein